MLHPVEPKTNQPFSCLSESIASYQGQLFRHVPQMRQVADNAKRGLSYFGSKICPTSPRGYYENLDGVPGNTAEACAHTKHCITCPSNSLDSCNGSSIVLPGFSRLVVLSRALSCVRISGFERFYSKSQVLPA